MKTSEILLPAVFLLAAASFAAAPRGGFQFRAAGADSFELTENGKIVYVYNHGMMLKPGVPEQFRRSSYLHPVYSPGGTLLTDDFPKDHYHHRGIFWAWRVVSFDGETHDLWTIEGIWHRFLGWIAHDTAPGSARLAVENGWFAGKRKVMKETVEIMTRAAEGGRRRMDFTLTFEAVGVPVELSGSPDRGYSGFGMRFAPREKEKTVVETDAGIEKEDTNLVPHPWAQLSAAFEGRPAGARIEVDPRNPGAPNGWCLRHYGYLGVDFPGLARFRLEPGRPVTLRYTVTLFDGK
jgi:hypothetical protein